MNTLADVVPELAAEIGAALTAGGRGNLVTQLASGIIERCTYDASVDAGYVYLIRPATSAHFSRLAAPVAETISFLHAGFNVDVDHDGHIFGLELLSREDFFTQLRRANAL